MPAPEPDQLGQGGATDDAVDGEAGVALELEQGAHGGVAEDAVHPPRVEAEAAQALLELGHVVTPQHGGPAVQEAVTEPKTGLHQGVPGLGTADAVHPQAPQCWKASTAARVAGPKRPSASTGGHRGRR